MEISTELISPEQAAQWLAIPHPHQRRTAPGKVRVYERAMREGRWLLTSQPIAIDPEARVLDGRHRLEAVVASGQPVSMLVARNVPEETFAVIDTGRKRSANQFISGPGADKQAAVARWLLWYERRFDTPPIGPNLTWDMDEVLPFVNDHKGRIEEAVARAVAIYKTSKITPSTHAAVIILANDNEAIDQNRFAEWLEGTETGADLAIGDPRLALRNRYISSVKGTGGTRNDWTMIVRSLNAFLNGDPVVKINLPSNRSRWPRVGA